MFIIGSQINFVGLLSTITCVTFIDIRPIDVELDNFNSKAGSILSLPYKNASVHSISCLHVIEHIGLGRYGDEVDPDGCKKAAKELIRILSPGGNLFLTAPIGKPCVYFNAHRVLSPQKILQLFKILKLTEFSVVTDEGQYIKNANIDDYINSQYACGLFKFSAP